MSNVNGILAPFGVLLLITVIILLSYLFARWRRDADLPLRLAGATAPTDHDTSDGGDDDDDRELGGVDEATIVSYPRLQYSQAAEEDIIHSDKGSNSSCSICLLDYQGTDTVRVLPECKHFFHVRCVDPWLKLHSTCPICRNQMITPPDGGGRSSGNNPLARRELSPHFTRFVFP